MYGKFGDDSFSTSELLHPIMKVWLRLIAAGPKYYIVSDKSNISLGLVDFSLYIRRNAFKDDHHHHRKKMDMVACTPVKYN